MSNVHIILGSGTTDSNNRAIELLRRSLMSGVDIGARGEHIRALTISLQQCIASLEDHLSSIKITYARLGLPSHDMETHIRALIFETEQLIQAAESVLEKK